MKPLKAKVSITIDNNIVEVLKTLAEEDDRSLSQYINLILKRYLKDMKERENNKAYPEGYVHGKRVKKQNSQNLRYLLCSN